MDADIGERAVDLMRSVGIEIDDGLTEIELDDIERRYEIAFAPEHRALPAAGLPVGPERFPNGEYRDWPQWRDGSEEPIRRRLAAPVEWLLPEDDGPLTWWHRSWGVRPTAPDDALAAARAAMGRWPTLIPVYAHRFMPAAPAPNPAPVLSVHGGDIIFYGSDLIDYLHHEFLRPPRTSSEPEQHGFAAEPLPVYPWSDLDFETLPPD